MSIQALKTAAQSALSSKKAKLTLVASGGVLVSSPSFANEAAAHTAAIQAAITQGTSMLQLTTGGILSLAAICFGVGIVSAMLMRR